MNLEQIKAKVASDEYGFLRTNEHLGSNIILLGLGGSHAYGTNIETSDLDVRGVALNRKMEILTNQKFEQFVNEQTDTTIYFFNKIVSLLANCNPNTIEMLGLRPEHYLQISPIGQELLDNKRLFLSRVACKSFGGYASQQLYRLQQKEKHSMAQSDLEKHILRTLSDIQANFSGKYTECPEDAIKLYIDKAVQEGYDTEIFMNVTLTHYPLRDYCKMWNELQNTVSSYKNVGKRNTKAIEHGKISKHMMHLVRLYYMCFDILERCEIITYREAEHDELMNIRNGAFISGDNEVHSSFYEMVAEFEKRLDYDRHNTFLPDKPNYKEITEFTASVNERVVKGEI